MLLGLFMVIAAQAVAVLPAETQYDPTIPKLKQVVGHESGGEITSPEGIVAYLKALSAAAPDRTNLVEYARSW
ncbi:MAG: hypothetical protein HXY20_04925 [Acidobacteria bacterium]|nr:hypothetical protein [Acidobacteriota bacterium]